MQPFSVQAGADVGFVSGGDVIFYSLVSDLISRYNTTVAVPGGVAHRCGLPLRCRSVLVV